MIRNEIYLPSRRTLVGLCAVFLVVLCSSSPALGQTDPDLIETTGDQSKNSELLQAIENYSRDLAELNGRYDESTTEIFMSLADAYTELGNYQQASRAYAEALAVVRSTSGLYSEQQLDLIDLSIRSSSSHGDWLAIENNYILANHIASRLYGRGDPRTLLEATRYASWKIRAYQYDIYREDTDLALLEAIAIYQRLIDALSETDADYRAKLTGYLYAKGLAHYYMTLFTSTVPLDDFSSSESRTMSMENCVQVRESGSSRTVCRQVQVSNPEYMAGKQIEKNSTMESHLAFMRQTFQQAVELTEADPDASAEELAIAVLHLGDVNFLAQDVGRSNAQYERADEILSADGVPKQLRDKLIGEPKKVLEGILVPLPIDAGQGSLPPIGTVNFTVTALGRFEELTITGSEAALTDENKDLVMDRLQQSFYRPRILDGELTDGQVSIPAAEL